jgi:hypothetical protein
LSYPDLQLLTKTAIAVFLAAAARGCWLASGI